MTLDVALSSLQWGVSEAIVNDHEVVKVCLDEIEACHRLSAGVSFFCMLGDKYGYRPPPQTLSQQTMAAAHQQLDATRRQLLDTWYCLDTNAVPPEYRLRPVTTVLGAQSEAEWPQTARELVNLLDNALASLQPASASKADSTRKLASGTQPADICVPLPSGTCAQILIAFQKGEKEDNSCSQCRCSLFPCCVYSLSPTANLSPHSSPL